MRYQHQVLAFVLSVLFLSCGMQSSPAPKSTSTSNTVADTNDRSASSSKQEVIGAYSVTVGEGVEQAVVQDNSPVTQGLQITSYNGGGILDIGEDRYINYGYKVTNQTGKTLNNLTFLAVNKSTFGTDAATYNIKNASGSIIPSAAPYMVPVNYIATANSDRTLLTFGRNLAMYQEDEISDTVKSYATANNLTVFPYGFTMRVPVTGVPIKTLENNAAALVTFSFKMPKSLGIAKFDYGFLAITDTETRVSQGVNETTEQNWQDTLARAKNLGADKITYFGTEPKTVDSATLTALSPYNPQYRLYMVPSLKVSKSLTHYAYSYNPQSYPTAQKASTSTQTMALGGKNTGLLGLNIPSGGLQVSYLLGTGDVKLAADYTAANKPNIVFNPRNTGLVMVLGSNIFDSFADVQKLNSAYKLIHTTRDRSGKVEVQSIQPQALQDAQKLNLVWEIPTHTKFNELVTAVQKTSNPFADSSILALADEIAKDMLPFLKGTVTGTVFTAEGNPSPNTSVTLSFIEKTFTKSTVTDANGNYSFTELPLYGTISLTAFNEKTVASATTFTHLVYGANIQNKSIYLTKTTVPEKGFSNGNFSDGTLKGWNTQGTVGLVSKDVFFPNTAQTQQSQTVQPQMISDYAAVVSTADKSGEMIDRVVQSSISKTFEAGKCIAGLQGKIRFLSNEYPKWYGSEYNDSYSVNVTTLFGMQTLAAGNLNTSQWGPGVGGFTGATAPQDIFLNLTQFQKEEESVPITLTFNVSDVGDSVVDSAIALADFQMVDAAGYPTESGLGSIDYFEVNDVNIVHLDDSIIPSDVVTPLYIEEDGLTTIVVRGSDIKNINGRNIIKGYITVKAIDCNGNIANMSNVNVKFADMGYQGVLKDGIASLEVDLPVEAGISNFASNVEIMSPSVAAAAAVSNSNSQAIIKQALPSYVSKPVKNKDGQKPSTSFYEGIFATKYGKIMTDWIANFSEQKKCISSFCFTNGDMVTFVGTMVPYAGDTAILAQQAEKWFTGKSVDPVEVTLSAISLASDISGIGLGTGALGSGLVASYKISKNTGGKKVISSLISDTIDYAKKIKQNPLDTLKSLGDQLGFIVEMSIKGGPEKIREYDKILSGMTDVSTSNKQALTVLRSVDKKLSDLEYSLPGKMNFIEDLAQLADIPGFEKPLQDIINSSTLENVLDAIVEVTYAAVANLCNNSFSPETEVLTKLGLLPIADLLATDGTGNSQAAQNTPSLVYAYNEVTRRIELQPVLSVISHGEKDQNITFLSVYDPETEKTEYITTTQEHPFYLEENVDNSTRPAPESHGELSNKWVGAGHLKIGDKVKQADGTVGIIVNVVIVQQTRQMFNLTVSEAHTYYVGYGGWLVHNGCFSFTAQVVNGQKEWVSPAGLIYGPDKHLGNKVLHVLDHLNPVSARTTKTATQTVFNVQRNELLPLLDKAWANRGAAVAGDAFRFEVPMGRVIGTNGETTIRIVADPITGRLVTAYPIK